MNGAITQQTVNKADVEEQTFSDPDEQWRQAMLRSVRK